MRPLPAFVYAGWTRFGVGSSVEFLEDRGNELNFKLVERDGRRALLAVNTDRAGMTTELGEPPLVVVWAQEPEPLPRPGSSRATALPETIDKLKQLIEEAARPVARRGPTLAEGKEVLQVDGLDRICAWVQMKQEKIWLLADIPGGIAQWESGDPPACFRLRFFELK